MNKKTPITVFGATGRIGSELIQLLSKAQLPTIAVTRNKGKVMPMPFVEWITADMNDKDSIRPAIAGSSSVFLISGAGESMIQEQCHAIDVAAEEKVAHVVKLSSAMADPHSSLFIGKAHGQIEAYLKASGVNSTILRPTGFMQNWLLGLAPTVKMQRKIYEATGDGKRAFIDLRDIAEVAFRILTAPEQHRCHAYLLTGGQAVNYGQLAEMITSAIGERVTYIPITPDAAKAQLEQKGVPSWNIDTFLSYAEDQRHHKADFVSDDLAEILQKPARTVEAFVKEHTAQFK